MDSLEMLKQSIKELQRMTGLPIDINTEGITDISETAEKVRSLCGAYRTMNQKEYMIKRWLTGEITFEDFYAFSSQRHLELTGKRLICLIRFEKEIYPEVIIFLKNILPDSRNWIIPFSQTKIMVVCWFPVHTHPDIKNNAYNLLDALNTELMEQVTISTSPVTNQPEELPGLSRQCILSMEVGQIFYPDRTIYCPNELGIGCLLYDTSREVCRDYIRNQIGDRFLHHQSPAFDSSIQNTVNCFLANNMNIAETARQLHMHRNTLLYRIEQIENETGLDIRRFEHAMTYKICSMILLYL